MVSSLIETIMFPYIIIRKDVNEGSQDSVSYNSQVRVFELMPLDNGHHAYIINLEVLSRSDSMVG